MNVKRWNLRSFGLVKHGTKYGLMNELSYCLDDNACTSEVPCTEKWELVHLRGQRPSSWAQQIMYAANTLEWLWAATWTLRLHISQLCKSSSAISVTRDPNETLQSWNCACCRNWRWNLASNLGLWCRFWSQFLECVSEALDVINIMLSTLVICLILVFCCVPV